MEITFDPRYSIGYIRLRDKPEQVETIQVSDELNVDIAPDGTVYGIELLNANEQLRLSELTKLVLTNESTGEQAEVQLPAA